MDFFLQQYFSEGEFHEQVCLDSGSSQVLRPVSFSGSERGIERRPGPVFESEGTLSWIFSMLKLK